MLRRYAGLVVLGGWLLAAEVLAAQDKPDKPREGFAWKDGDKVALIGGTMIEREQSFGH